MTGFDGATRARRRFGQNFLVDVASIERILAAIQPRAGDTIVEIGPGRGALTEGLITSGARLHVVEIDRDLAAIWRARESARFSLHVQDALAFDFTALAPEAERLRIVGNLPYNISTPLLFHLLGQAQAVCDMHFMLQREVVERLGALPGTADYGRLSVMVQYQCRVQPLLAVPPHAFAPAPRVQSALVRLLPGHYDHGRCAMPSALAGLVRQAFSHRRKTLRNALAGQLDTAALERLGIDPGRRPETLTVAEFVRLADQVADTQPEVA